MVSTWQWGTGSGAQRTGCAGAHLAVKVEGVAVHGELMTAHDALQRVGAQQQVDGQVTEPVAGLAHLVVDEAAVLAQLGAHGRRRVGPEQVAHQSHVGHVQRLHQAPRVVQLDQVRRDAAVHAQQRLGHQAHQRQVPEALLEGVPQRQVESFHALLSATSFPTALKCANWWPRDKGSLEPEHGVHLARLVVASQQVHVGRIADLQVQKQADDFDTLGSSVNIVAHE